MQQLNSWDAAFLYGETHFAPMHICSVAHFAPGADGQQLSLAEVRAAARERLHLLPPFRRRVVHVPFGLDRPYWIDGDVCIEEHVHEVTLPPPGNPAQLAEQVAEIAARPLDLRRPLWELYLIRGVENDQTVLVTKLHHAAVDGMSGAEIQAILLDPAADSPAPPAPGPADPERVPGPGEMLLRGLAGAATYPVEALRFQRRLIGRAPHLIRPAEAESGRRGWQLSLPPVTAPPTPLNGRLSAERSWAYGQVPLSEVKAIKNALGGTVNDVVMSVCAGALRKWLLDYDALPKEPLVVMVPVSLRTEQERRDWGNRVSMMMATLPVNVSDPVQRLRATTAASRKAKHVHAALGEDFLAGALQLAMPMMATPAFQITSELPFTNLAHPSANLFISNVPGPSAPLYLAGKKMLTYYPAAFLPRGTGLNMVVLSYLGYLDFGLMACPERVPGVWRLMRHVIEAVDELADAAGIDRDREPDRRARSS
ncbi:MAG TPA: wax ester/triacylglycerol synthase family O-acyltransferase [Streptosporangiaceae bacterium]|nr:wax ester/triacylglycerol synthase family O-acyltransferase [Streptosporangiaceae bacterium]